MIWAFLMAFRKSFSALCSLGLAAIFSTPCQAWDQAASLPAQLAAVDFQSVLLSRADAQGFWSTGQLAHTPALLRYDLHGHVLLVVHLHDSATAIASTSAGRVYLTDERGDLLLFDAGGTLLMQRVHRYDSGDPYWSALSPGTDGDVWATADDNDGYFVAHFDADGTQSGRVHTAALGITSNFQMQADSAGRGAYVVGATGGHDYPDSSTHAAIVALDGAAGVRWRWESRETSATILDKVAVAADGSVMAAGRLSVGYPDVNNLYVVSANGAGSDVRDGHFVDLSPNQVDGIAVNADGARFVLATTSMPDGIHVDLHGLDAANRLLWSKSLPPCHRFDCATLQLDGMGSAVVRVWNPEGDNAHVSIVRYDAAGGLRASASVIEDTAYQHDWIVLPDNSIVRNDGSFSHDAFDGTALAPIDTHAVAAPVAAVSASALDQVNGAYTLSQAIEPHQHTLLRTDSQGHVIWQEHGDGVWLSVDIGLVYYGGAPALQMQSGADLLCVLGVFFKGDSNGQAKLECRHRSDGSIAWSVPLEFNPNQIFTGSYFHILADGHVVLIRQKNSQQYDYQAWDAQGHVVVDTLWKDVSVQLNAIATNASGELALVRTRYDVSSSSAPITEFVRMRADTSVLQTTALPGLVTVRRMALADDHTAFALTSQDDAVHQNFSGFRVDASGKMVATEPLLSLSVSMAWNTAVSLTDQDSYVLVTPGPCCLHIQDKAYALRVNGASGKVKWRHEDASRESDQAPRWAGTQADSLVAIVADRNRLHVRQYDPFDGSVNDTIEDCLGDCILVDATASIGGPLRVLATHADAADDWRASVFSSALLPQPGPTIAIDQPAISGSWWAPYTAGQGFMLDYLADSHTFFMPWFTFDPAGGNDPAQQRWYTIQGNVPTAATALELGIYDSRGGAFDRSQATQATRVGTANLRFADCDHASLHYHFDAANFGTPDGDITLNRLLPRTQACVLADGSTLPATSTPPAQNGFDTRMSGSWYEPATAGQGLQLDVHPGGTVFAAWFTYDPQGHADDVTAQHWLTLQGSLADAKDGVASVAIAQAIGGSLDGVPTANQYAVGHATLTVIRCDALRVDYQFDDSAIAAAYRNISGTLDLVRIGGCPAQ